MLSNSDDNGLAERKVPGSSLGPNTDHHSSLKKQEIGSNTDNLTRLQRWRRSLFWDDPRDDQDLQPNLEETLVRKKEIWGFMLFGVGYYTYANTCQSLLLPILIQGVARGAARLESNWNIMCPEDDADIPSGDRCLVPFGWIRVTPTSYVLLTNVVLTWCAVAFSLGVSAVADHGRRSKKMTLFFTGVLCFISCFMFMGAQWSGMWWFCGLLYVLAGVMNSVILNFYDAMIPNLTKYHPTVVRTVLEHGEGSEEYIAAKTKVQTFLSGGASASGYAGGLFLTIIIALILLFVGQTLLIVGYCVILVAVYIALVSLFFVRFAVQRTFPPLPPGSNKYTYGYKRIAKTVAKARKLKTMFYFLCCWFILGDGLTSSSNMAILIAQSDLQLGSSSLIIAALIQFITAGLGMVFWIWMQNSRGMAPKKVVILNSVLFGLIPLYCLLALIPGCPIGLQHEWELYMLAAFFGFFQGAIYSSNRVVYAQFVPRGHENELFALYEISSSASSWIAPLVCTAIIESSSTRKTWIFLATQFFIPAAMLCFVDVEKGRAEGIAFYNAEQAEKKKIEDEAGLMTEVRGGRPTSPDDMAKMA